jgi:hypothetical protein
MPCGVAVDNTDTIPENLLGETERNLIRYKLAQGKTNRIDERNHTTIFPFADQEKGDRPDDSLKLEEKTKSHIK